MKDELGDRMKSYYEDRTRVYLPRRTYTIIRIDGKAFHTYTRGLSRPFDVDLIKDMDATAQFLCENIQGAKLAYVQSDEISILSTDFDKPTTSAWFDGNLQKMVSIAASLTTSKFNQLRMLRYFKTNHQGKEYFNLDADELKAFRLAHFDARVFSIPPREEVINYFIWRQQDATRNSISAVAQSLYSHKQLEGITTDQMQELIFKKGQNWNDFPIGQKRGRVIYRTKEWIPISLESGRLAAKNPKTAENVMWSRINFNVPTSDSVEETDAVGQYSIKRNVWKSIDPPIFTKDKDFLRTIIPVNN